MEETFKSYQERMEQLIEKGIQTTLPVYPDSSLT